MDVGSNNGQGVIPAPPTAWTRLHQGWEQAVELVGNIELAARHLPAGQIGRVTLSKDEYLLIENRLNWVPGLPGVSMDSLRYRNGDPNEYGGLDLPHYFDYLVDSAGVTVDPATGVITSVPNYDLGLPGSGLLIWHVDQARYTPDMQGLNDDPEARAVALEEADGAVDIGFPTTALISDPIQGWYWDLWFAGNEAFFVANPDRRVNNPDRLMSLDYDTYPSSALNSGAESGIAIRGIGFAGETLSLSVGDESDVTRLPEGSRLTCFNGNDWIYRNLGGWWVLGDHQIGEGYSNQHVIISEHDAVSGQKSNAFWILETTQYGGVGYSARRFNADGSLIVELMDSVGFDEAYFIDGQLHIGLTDTSFGAPPDSELIAYYHAHSLPASVRSDNRWGYLWDTDEYSEVIQTRYSGYQYDSLTAVLWSSSDDVSLGDVDGDGLDEIVAISPGGAYQTSEIKEMIAVNADGMRLDGFPVTGQFESSVLLANLMDDIRPELIVVESGDIAIYNPEGEELERLGLHTGAYSLFLLHFPDGRVGLANGDRIHWFEPEVQNLQWVTMEGRFSGNRYSLNTGVAEVSQPAVLDKSRVYNYPNPVLDGATTIRFYVGTAQKATISIYTIDGLLVEKVELTDLAINDYNEWVWEVGDQPSGLYYGAVEVEGAGSESALIKIAVVR
ncbi:MAG: T9SS type A sorting domain-containing protein [Fidelibacterota bacterium]|nr:MAG: T9SS type A sorting domain-containing protein [Candidatus Neomarinimicrobiota bacterium]